MAVNTVETPLKSIPKSGNDSSTRIQEIFKLQQANLQYLKNTSGKERRKKLKALKNKVFEYRTKIQEALNADFQKPATESDISEIYPVVSELKHTIAHFEDWMEREEVDIPITMLGSSAYVHYEPKGSCLVITPWNYPFYLAVSPLIYAIAAGNAAILKPSEFTPNTSQLVKEMLAELFEEKEIAVVQGDYQVSSELLKLKFNHIHFTGSPMVGKIVMEAASRH
ncbi:MAG: aldehyde dehydrogenase (NAD+), partial [Chitinophagales bacterium]